MRTRKEILASLSTCIGIVSGFVLLMGVSPAVADDIPSSAYIEGVPLYQQIDAKGCGAVSLQMAFEYYGPFIDQREIYNAARSGGTTLPDMARAAQFSELSSPEGDRWPTEPISDIGYTNRPLGYAGFFYASTEPWLDELKYIVSQGYPMITLVEWLPDIEGPHYRVIVGYDDARGVLLIHDGWVREFKDDMCYSGSATQLSNEIARDTEFCAFEMTYEDFLKTWECPTDTWGVPGLAYGGVFVTPWEVEISSPSEVAVGQEFTVSATITYPIIDPFGSSSFPTFDASDPVATLEVGDGLTVVGDPTISIADPLLAGQSATVSWSVEASSEASASTYLLVTGTGFVSGSLGPWHDYPAYDYADIIGGSGTVELSVVAQ